MKYINTLGKNFVIKIYIKHILQPSKAPLYPLSCFRDGPICTYK